MENESISNWFEKRDHTVKKETVLDKILDKKHIILISLFFITIAAYLSHFFITNIPAVEGYIYEKSHESEVVRHFLDKRGEGDSREYSVLKHTDGEDFTISIKRSTLTDPDKIVRFKVHLDKDSFNSLEIGDFYKGRKFDYFRVLKDNNNKSKRVYGWSSIAPTNEDFPNLQ